MTPTVVTDLAGAVDPTLPSGSSEHVDFATSMVDRITPVTTDERPQPGGRGLRLRRRIAGADRAVRRVGDLRPVPAGRPAWEDAGARLVDDVTPFEQRKLWLLNGSHSLLAYAGSIRGHASIDEAIADPPCRRWVEALWDEAAAPPAARRRDRGLPGGAAGPVRQPAHPPPAGPDRGRRLHQADRPDRARACRARRRAGPVGLRHRRGRLDPAPARPGRPDQGSRRGSRWYSRRRRRRGRPRSREYSRLSTAGSATTARWFA